MTLTFVFQGREATCILCDELFQIYKNFTKLRMLQATNAFPGGALHPRRGRQRGSGERRPPSRSASLALPERASQGNPVPLI